jgi:hypothetical protein
MKRTWRVGSEGLLKLRPVILVVYTPFAVPQNPVELKA